MIVTKEAVMKAALSKSRPSVSEKIGLGNPESTRIKLVTLLTRGTRIENFHAQALPEYVPKQAIK
jgi:hypothetical protein